MTGPNLDERTTSRRRRWRRLTSIVSGSLTLIAVGGAVYLGATGPLVSPVQPPAPPAAAAADPAGAGGAVDTDRDQEDRGGRGRADARGFGRHR